MTSTTTPNQQEPNHQAILAELIALGTDLARRVHAAAPQPGTRPTPEIAAALAEATIAFDRIARAVRRTIRLADHLARHPQTPGAQTPEPTTPRTEKRKHVLRRVENVIARAKREAPESDSLRAELLERLDAPEGEFDIATQTVEHVINDIIRDFGLAEGIWPRRRPADLAALQARAERIPPTPNTTPPPGPEPAPTRTTHPTSAWPPPHPAPSPAAPYTAHRSP